MEASAAPTPHEQALDLFDRGRAAYREGRFQDSVDLISQAYQIEKEPVLLYNLARAYEGLSDFDRAVSTYEQYLREAKEIPDRAAIEQRVANLKKTIAEREKLAKERDDALKAQAAKPTPDAPHTAVQPLAPSSSGRRPLSPVPWIVTGIGVAGLGAGAGLGIAALSKNKSAESAPSQAAAVAQHDSAKGIALGSTIGLVTGGILVAGGVTWGIIDIATRPSAVSKPDVKVTLGLTSAGVAIDF